MSGTTPQGPARAVAFLLAMALVLAVCGACRHKAPVAPPQPPAAPPPPPRQAPPAAASATPPPPAAAAAPAVPIEATTAGPSIRICVASGTMQATVSSSADFYLQEKVPESALQLVKGPIEVRVEREDARGTIYRVQVASLSRRDSAEELSRKLGTELGAQGVVRRSSTGLFQVRLGEFAKRDEAQRFATGPVRSAGYQDAFVVEETVQSASGETVLAVRGPRDLFRVQRSGFLFFPASETEFLRLDGKAYRGIFDFMIDRNGRMTVVNQLGVEDYLLGVVPAEMSPSVYPEPAALAAQAIAARTYALKNMGRYRSEGYDLTNDIRTQVYGGVAAERAPATEAVRSTSGLAVYYDGKLIDAMYTSTCGGRTEDYAAVFDSPPVPYLVGVLCAVESESAAGTANIRGSHALDRLVTAGDGRIANREIELALLLGIAPPEAAAPEFLENPAEEPEIKNWVESTRRSARRSRAPEPKDISGIGTHAGFMRYAAEAIIGSQELQRGISPADAAYYMANLKDGAAVPEAARVPIAFFLQKGLWLSFPDNSVRPGEPILRKDALALLVRTLLHVRPETLSSASLADITAQAAGGAAGPELALKWGNRSQKMAAAPAVRLFQRAGERSVPAEGLLLIGNEKLSIHLDPDGRIDFLEVVLNPTGAASDRFSPVASWQVEMPRAQVAEKLRPLAPDIGELRDLEPARIGSSGRVLQLRLIGTRRAAVVNGYRARNALGLRDTLFTIRRSIDPNGEVAGFIFDGRGYGHGVGLCQVGAFGMARAGRSYEEILKTYYTGVEIRKAY